MEEGNRRAVVFVPRPEHLDHRVLGADVPRLGKRITISLRSVHDLDLLVLRVTCTPLLLCTGFLKEY